MKKIKACGQGGVRAWLLHGQKGATVRVLCVDFAIQHFQQGHTKYPEVNKLQCHA